MNTRMHVHPSDLRASANGVIWCLVYFQCTHPLIAGVSEGLIAFYAARVANVCLRVNYGIIVSRLLAQSLPFFPLLPFLRQQDVAFLPLLFFLHYGSKRRSRVSFLRTSILFTTHADHLKSATRQRSGIS